MGLTLRRLWIQLTADRKRFGMLCAVLGIGMLLWARLIVVSNIPRTAMADDPHAPADKAPAKTEKSAPKSVAPPPTTSAKVPVDVELSVIPQRDPFVINTTFFPKPTSPDDMAKEEGKSPSEAAEEPEQIEARFVARLRAVAERFKLEAAVSGTMAVINGRTFRIGDDIAGTGDGSETVRFRLEEVKQRSVILECEGRRFEIQMASPGG